MKTLGTWYMLLEGDKVTRNIYFICQVGKKCHENTYIWYILLEGDKMTWEYIFDMTSWDKMSWKHIYLVHLTWGGIKWHGNIYLIYRTWGDKMSWRHLYLIHLTWGGIKWHERGLDDSVWPPLREFWGSVARRKGHHSLPAKSIISSHYLLIFLHFILFTFLY